MTRRLLYGLILAFVASTAALAACGSEGDAGAPRDASVGDGDNDAGGGDGSPGLTDKCSSSAQCDGGVCIVGAGVCCQSAASVCGKTCCGGGSVCLFDACVIPGKPCMTGNECAPGEYCEPGLGGSQIDAGASDAGCSQLPPRAGKCLPLPPTCAPDAGALPDGGGCVPACEYHPPPGGMLDTKTRWTWGPKATFKPTFSDVWSTPTVGRVHDNNCDGKVDQQDTPVAVFVSGEGVDGTGKGTCCQCTGGAPTSCHTGVLRMLDGATGAEIWSLDKASNASAGFAGLSTAIADIDGDGFIDIVAATGEGYLVLIDRNGKVLRISDKPIAGAANAPAFGWGGALAIADMDGDGFPEIAFGSHVYSTTNNALTLKWVGVGGAGGESVNTWTSTFVDLDGAIDGHLELLGGHTAYRADGSVLWNRPTIPDGFPGVGDFDLDGKPDVAIVASGQLWIVEGATGVTKLGPVALPGTGSGGPPTVADFDGDKKPEIGVAMATFYSVMKPDFVGKTIKVAWKTPNHDLSSSVTGSTVFDFEGDGKAEVVYGDECFLWVFDGSTGAVRFAASHSSFTATEASLVADIDGDGHADMLMVSNGADPKSWGCLSGVGTPVTVNGVTWVPGPAAGSGYRGLSMLSDSASSWVGTRTLWNEHSYHVSNICDDRDQACSAPNLYGAVPKVEAKNWTLPWLNNFRQNVQDKGVFNAPNAVVSLKVDCATPVPAHVTVRNLGQSGLAAGVDVRVYVTPSDAEVGAGFTSRTLLPGQTETIDFALSPTVSTSDTFYARIVLDKAKPKFHQCREDDDRSELVSPPCVN